MSTPIDSITAFHSILSGNLKHRSLDRFVSSSNQTKLPGGTSVNYDEKKERLTGISYESGFKVVVNESLDGQRVVMVQNPHGNFLFSSSNGFWYVLD